jgi:ferredoxin
MHISLEKDKCITSGQCVLLAPQVFDQDDDGIVVLLADSPGPELQDSVREAASLCPAQLIHLSDD